MRQLLEVDVHFDVSFGRLAIQQERLVFPLPYGIRRSLAQQRGALQHLYGADGTIFSDQRLYGHVPLHTSLPRRSRIERRNTVD